MQRKSHIKTIIRTEVENIRAFDTLEQEHIDDVIGWIDSGANLFRVEKPNRPPKHLCAYFALVDPTHKSILLADHIIAQLWLPTGGHVHLDEDPRATVIREAKEELDISATFLRNNTHPFFVTVTKVRDITGLTPDHTDVSLWYLLRGDKHAFINYDKREFTDIEWFSFDEILTSDSVIFDRHMHRFTKKLANYLA